MSRPMTIILVNKVENYWNRRDDLLLYKMLTIWGSEWMNYNAFTGPCFRSGRSDKVKPPVCLSRMLHYITTLHFTPWLARHHVSLWIRACHMLMGVAYILHTSSRCDARTCHIRTHLLYTYMSHGYGISHKQWLRPGWSLDQLGAAQLPHFNRIQINKKTDENTWRDGVNTNMKIHRPCLKKKKMKQVELGGCPALPPGCDPALDKNPRIVRPLFITISTSQHFECLLLFYWSAEANRISLACMSRQSTSRCQLPGESSALELQYREKLTYRILYFFLFCGVPMKHIVTHHSSDKVLNWRNNGPGLAP
jgi:hypothetical protein